MEENKTYEYEEMSSLQENLQDVDLPVTYVFPPVPETNEKSNLPVVGLAIAGTAVVIGIGVRARNKFCAWKKDWQEFKEWREANVEPEAIESEEIFDEATNTSEEVKKDDQGKESKKK